MFKPFNFFSLKAATANEEFDADTTYILSIFYAFGLYHPSPSKTRMAYGIFMSSFAVQMYLLGAVKNIFGSWFDGDILQAMVNAAAIPFGITLQAQIITFVFKQPEVIKLLKELQSINQKMDGKRSTVYKQEYQKIVTFYKFFLVSGSFVLIIMKAVGFQVVKLIVPALFDVFAEGSLFNFFLAVSIAQLVVILVTTKACDLLHILCMMRIEASYESLAMELRECANGDNAVLNEKMLIGCIKYHCRILRNVQKLFKVNFLTKVHTMFVDLTLMFIILVQVDLDSQALFFIIALQCLILSLFQFGTLCYFGQRLLSKSADLIHASYECNWLDQTKCFKKLLTILRTICLNDSRFIVGKFNFSYEGFTEVIYTSYLGYTHLSSLDISKPK